jgi:phospholipid-binding lipoprotein MlaA
MVSVACALAVAGCASVPTDPEEKAEYVATNDPLEPTNRAIFDFDQFLDKNLLRPVAVAYRDNVPEPAQRGIHNLLSNLGEPMIFANDVLQANPSNAWNTVQRFVVNSTVGVAGIFDVASGWGLPYHSADLGQTFGVWGIPDGPYLVLPLFGPSSPRDAVGLGATIYADPIGNIAANNGASVVNYITAGSNAVDQRSRSVQTLDDIERTSLDFYAAIRSLYRQRRAADVREGKNPGATSAPASIEVHTP